MKITKFVHSCLLVEDSPAGGGKRVLIDPGIYSYQARALNLDSLGSLAYLLITHEHADHFHLPFVKEIVAKFPDVKIVTDASVVEILNKAGVSATSNNDDVVKNRPASHEPIFGGPAPTNALFEVFGSLTHPGDSFHFELLTPLLALPVQAPWGSTTEAVNLALKLKPKVIVPIHDWHWNEEGRKSMYSRLESFFAENGISFKPLETGQAVEI